MSTVSVEFPVLIRTVQQQGKTHYRARPLFLLAPSSQDRRFNKAIANLIKEVRRQFAFTKTERSNISELLWLFFNPEIHFQKKRLEFKIGQRFVSGEFTIVWFNLAGQRVVCLPGFENFFFIATRNQHGRYRLMEQIQDTISYLLKIERRELNEIRVEPHLASEGEMYTTVQCPLELRRGNFPFVSDESSWLISLFRRVEFDGGWELAKTATTLDNLYPHDLLRAYHYDRLVERVGQIVYNKSNSPLVLVGASGVGKTTIVHEILYRYLAQNEHKKSGRLETTWHLEPTRVIAGMSIVGMWQSRFESMLDYIVARARKSGLHDKLFFDNVVALLRVGKSAQNDMTLSDVLKPYLEKRKIQVIAAATPGEWKLVQELDRRFADLFQVIRVPEPDAARATKIILQQRVWLESANDCHIDIDAVARLLVLQRTYLRRQALPGSVVKLLKQMAVKYRYSEVDIAAIDAEFQATHQLNPRILDRSLRFSEGEVRGELEKKLIGQPQALHCLANAVHTIKACLNNPDKPAGSFLFIGPTGVGKTQAAKVLAEYLFCSSDNLLRFDMNEYIDSMASARLIGDLESPEGQLTGRVRYHPFCVLLFDEIEKAHPQIHDLLLQVLGEARLSDALGRTVDFSNCVIIMTSNIGAKEAGHTIGFQDDPARRAAVYRKAVEDFFRPEFLNRIDEIVVFQQLQLADVVKIAQIQIKDLLQRDGFLRRTTILNISQQALKLVAERGFDPELGGRALKRSIEKDLTALTADRLVEIPAGSPIIFEIFVVAERLIPRVIPLIESTPRADLKLPEIPSARQALPYYQALLAVCRRIDAALIELRPQLPELQEQPQTWLTEYYLLKDRLSRVVQELQQLVWVMEDAEVINPAAAISIIPYRARWRRREFVWSRADFPDFFSRHDLREYLQDLYLISPAVVKESQSQYFRYFIAVAYLYFFHRGLCRQQIDHVAIHIYSRIENAGAMEVKYLTSNYARLLDHFYGDGLDYPTWDQLNSDDCHPDDKHRSGAWEIVNTQDSEVQIMASGLRLYDLLAGESGIHLFEAPYQPPIPISVKIIRLPASLPTEQVVADLAKAREHSQDQTSSNSDNETVIRIYCLASEASDDIVTDLRTRMITRSAMSSDDWKLLLYTSFSEEDWF